MPKPLRRCRLPVLGATQRALAPQDPRSDGVSVTADFQLPVTEAAQIDGAGRYHWAIAFPCVLGGQVREPSGGA